MRFSILTPSFNQGAFLERNIQSVLNQDVPRGDIEHLVIDGGSTDSTLSVIEQYSKQLAYWVSEADGGQADALAKGLARATGDIIGWVNVDEFYEPNVFAAVRRAFEENPRAVVVYGNVRLVLPNGEPIRVKRQWNFDYEVCRIQTPIIVNCGAFFRRDRLVACGGFDRSWRCLMDWEMYIRMMRGEQEWVRLKRVLGNFTLHKQSKTSTLQPVFESEKRRLREREFPGMSDEEFETRRLRQVARMQRHIWRDGAMLEKIWFKLVRQRRYAGYFGDQGTRLPVISRLLDIVYPAKYD